MGLRVFCVRSALHVMQTLPRARRCSTTAISSHLLFIPCQLALSITRDNDRALENKTKPLIQHKEKPSQKKEVKRTPFAQSLFCVTARISLAMSFGISIFRETQKSTSIR